MLTEGEEILLLGLKLAIFGRENEVLIDDLDIKSYGTITFTHQTDNIEKALLRKSVYSKYRCFLYRINAEPF